MNSNVIKYRAQKDSDGWYVVPFDSLNDYIDGFSPDSKENAVLNLKEKLKRLIEIAVPYAGVDVDFREEVEELIIPIQVDETDIGGWRAYPIDPDLEDLLYGYDIESKEGAIAELRKDVDRTLKALAPLMGKKIKVQEK